MLRPFCKTRLAQDEWRVKGELPQPERQSEGNFCWALGWLNQGSLAWPGSGKNPRGLLCSGVCSTENLYPQTPQPQAEIEVPADLWTSR